MLLQLAWMAGCKTEFLCTLVVTCQQYGISALIYQLLFDRKAIGGVAKCWPFFLSVFVLKQYSPIWPRSLCGQHIRLVFKWVPLLYCTFQTRARGVNWKSYWCDYNLCALCNESRWFKTIWRDQDYWEFFVLTKNQIFHLLKEKIWVIAF